MSKAKHFQKQLVGRFFLSNSGQRKKLGKKETPSNCSVMAAFWK
jgi:hypothetical protein